MYSTKKYIVLTVLAFMVSFFANAAKKTRILFLLDASSSMTLPWSTNYSKYDVASNILLKIIDSVYSVNNEVEFAVRAYGTQHVAQEKNCYDTKLEVPFNYQNISQIKTRLLYLKPIGYSPIAYSLEQASQNELSQTSIYDYSIIFITDGGESCNGDVCATFNHFLQNKIAIKPYVIGLEVNQNLKSYYDCMGNYIDVTSAEDIPKAVSMIVDANKKIIEKPKQLNLTTTFSNTQTIKDTVKKVAPIVKPILKKDELPYLDFSKYPFVVKAAKIKPTPIKIKNTNKATLRFDYEEPKQTPLEKPAMFALDNEYIFAFEKEIFVLKNLTATKIITNKKATLRFEIEEPTSRQTDVFPKLYSGNAKNIVINKPILKPKPISLKTKEKGIFKFDYEEPVTRQTDVFPKLQYGEMKNVAIKKTNSKPKAISLKTKDKGVFKFDYEERQTQVIPKLESIESAGLYLSKIKLKPKNINLKTKEKGIYRFEYEEPKKETMTRLIARDFPKRMGYGTRVPSEKDKVAYPKQRATIRFTIEEEKPVVKKDTSKPKPTTTTKADEITAKVETQSSAETQVQIFIYGPNGKEYPKAKPIIEVVDSKTGAVAYTFTRTMENGAPKIEKVKEGVYSFFIREYNVARAYDVKIEANKLNKVSLYLKNGTLHFSYTSNYKRPVLYNAYVNRRFAAGASVMQKCIDVLTYEPGTYYVEINTFPEIKRSFDIEFYQEYIFAIQEPGSVQFDNQIVGLKKVMIQVLLGDAFVNYKEIDINKKQEIQPGVYKVVFPKDPKVPLAGSKVVDFKIESNKNTIVTIQ